MRIYTCSFDLANLSDKSIQCFPNSQFGIGIKMINNGEIITPIIDSPNAEFVKTINDFCVYKIETEDSDIILQVGNEISQ
jgi:adenine-specific DNA methylase